MISVAKKSFYLPFSPRPPRSVNFAQCYNHRMTSRPIMFRIHAIQRMFERHVSEEKVKEVVQSGEMIEDYSDEMPYPSGLMLGGRGPAGNQVSG